MRIASIIGLIVIATVAFAGDNAPWVDMKGCPICSNVSSQEGLMENMTWEHHLTATGVMTSSTIRPEFQPQFAKAKAAMKELMGKVVAGEDVQVCGYCSSIASLLKNGAKAENIVTTASDIMLISSTDQAMITEIHTHAQKTIDFLSAAH
jgi:hypothetical protein